MDKYYIILNVLRLKFMRCQSWGHGGQWRYKSMHSFPLHRIEVKSFSEL